MKVSLPKYIETVSLLNLQLEIRNDIQGIFKKVTLSIFRKGWFIFSKTVYEL